MIRVDELLHRLAPAQLEQAELGKIIFVLTEFQVCDAQTAADNEQGDSSHIAYKERKHVRVRNRLTGGSRSHRERSGPVTLPVAAPSSAVGMYGPPTPPVPTPLPRDGGNGGNRGRKNNGGT